MRWVAVNLGIILKPDFVKQLFDQVEPPGNLPADATPIRHRPASSSVISNPRSALSTLSRHTSLSRRSGRSAPGSVRRMMGSPFLKGIEGSYASEQTDDDRMMTLMETMSERRATREANRREELSQRHQEYMEAADDDDDGCIVDNLEDRFSSIVTIPPPSVASMPVAPPPSDVDPYARALQKEEDELYGGDNSDLVDKEDDRKPAASPKDDSKHAASDDKPTASPEHDSKPAASPEDKSVASSEDDADDNHDYFMEQINLLSQHHEEPEENDLTTEENKTYECGRCGGPIRGDQGYCYNSVNDAETGEQRQCLGTRKPDGKEDKPSLSELFGMHCNEWRCDVCNCKNKKTSSSCESCNNEKGTKARYKSPNPSPSTNPTALDQASTTSGGSGGGFTFGGKSSSSFTFGGQSLSGGGATIAFETPPIPSGGFNFEQEPAHENWLHVTAWEALTVGAIIFVLVDGRWRKAEVIKVNQKSMRYKILGESETRNCRDLTKIKTKPNA